MFSSVTHTNYIHSPWATPGAASLQTFHLDPPDQPVMSTATWNPTLSSLPRLPESLTSSHSTKPFPESLSSTSSRSTTPCDPRSSLDTISTTSRTVSRCDTISTTVSRCETISSTSHAVSRCDTASTTSSSSSRPRVVGRSAIRKQALQTQVCNML
eukprot:sb/3473146/